MNKSHTKASRKSLILHNLKNKANNTKKVTRHTISHKIQVHTFLLQTINSIASICPNIEHFKLMVSSMHIKKTQI